jgi:hypothetical protein
LLLIFSMSLVLVNMRDPFLIELLLLNMGGVITHSVLMSVRSTLKPLRYI